MQVPKRKGEALRRTKMTHDPHMTEEKHRRLTSELERLRHERPAAAEEVQRMAAMGDLSENAGYQVAKQTLRRLNNRMLSLEQRIKHAQIIEKPKDGTVGLGSTVEVILDGGRRTYEIVGSQESDPFKGRISHHSPIGAQLIGHKAGDAFVLNAGDNDLEITIIEVR